MKRRFLKRDTTIKQFFEDSNFNGICAFDEKSIYEFLYSNKNNMNTKSFSLNKFIKYLLDNEFIFEFEFENNINDKKIYVSKYFNNKSDYAKALEVSSLLIPKSYISYFSSMYHYNLTQQLPKKIYLSVERKSNAPHNALKQEVINKALCKEGRLPAGVLSMLGYEIYLVHAKEANRVGIKRVLLFDKDYRITTLERTLVDIVVRSEISGGIEEVVQAYKKAFELYRDTIFINKIIFILKKLNYIYPYHQVIGYLLSKSGFDASNIKKEFEFKNDFFLARGIVNENLNDLDYNQEFRLYIPKNLSKIF
jgi:predicted nucleic-acid-binding protein